MSIFLIGCVILLWMVMRHRLVIATEDLRLEVAERSGKLLASPHLDESIKQDVAVACQLSFSSGAMWRLALCFPFYALWGILVNPELLKDNAEHIKDPDVHKEFTLVRSLSLLSAMTLSPFFALFVVLEMIVIVFVVSFTALSYEQFLALYERLSLGEPVELLNRA